MVERKSKTDELKSIESPKEIEAKEPLILISFNEFISTLMKDNRIETVGAFISWVQRKTGEYMPNGIQRKLSLEIWKSYFNEFITRKT